MFKFIRIKFPENKKKFFFSLLKGYFWFFCGAFLGLFFFVSFSYIIYKNNFAKKIYPGIYIDNIDFSGKSKQDVYNYFQKENERIQKSVFVLYVKDNVATISAKDLNFGYDTQLLADQSYSIGRASNIISNSSLILQAYFYGIHLTPSYQYDTDKLLELIEPIKKKLYVEAVDAKFYFEEGRVKEFKASSDGQELDLDALLNKIHNQTLTIITAKQPGVYTIPIPIKVLKPERTTEEVNNLGIKELIGSGSSSYSGSIANRAYNIALAATRLNGILIKPDEIFSFNKSLGDVSLYTGYKQAYVIQNGRTVLGDGGGVCQVSTTFFRAALNSGLPIVERNAHAYRVGYYEQDSGPGFDAAIYVPSTDFKFKNDTGHYLLVQTIINTEVGGLTFELYGTKDNREVEISKPVVSSVTSSPEPLYIDDPTLPKGEIKQIDYAVSGANVYFTRVVKKEGKIILSDKFNSNYRPWQAVYQKGTKE